jgi:deoxyribonuclease V
MKAALDVAYEAGFGYAAAVAFQDWSDAEVIQEELVVVSGVQPYQPGRFFQRELPCLLAVLRALPPLETVLIDGYVWLDSLDTPGLGARLFQALEGEVAVIGVAKTRFRGAEHAMQITRGQSSRPLFITAAGLAKEIAATYIKAMHGPNRIPTLLRRAHLLAESAKKMQKTKSFASQ